jgi:hypothetical protein
LDGQHNLAVQSQRLREGEHGPALWTAGDWNAFFGFGTNILVTMLVLTGLLRVVLKMPDWLVFRRILPALAGAAGGTLRRMRHGLSQRDQ